MYGILIEVFYMKKISFFLFLLFMSLDINAGSIRLAPYFQSNMVLQQGEPVTLWGTALPGETIRAVFDGETASCTAGEGGEWKLVFAARKASFDSKELQVGDTVLHNILIGEVWVCSGQSNMAMRTSVCDNETRGIQKGEYANIRLLNYSGISIVANDGYTEEELSRCNVDNYFRYTWEVASYDRFQAFSAVATHFGIQLYRKINVPVGLVCCAVGGSAINNWIPEQVLKHHPLTRSLYESDWLSNEDVYINHRERCRNAFKRVLPQGKAFIPGKLPYRFITEPGFAYEASFARIGKVRFRGVLWYQGESDAYSGKSVMNYEVLFRMLVDSWRLNFENPDLPFVVVQLPRFNSPYWPDMRVLQERLCRQIPEIFLVGTKDMGDEQEIHYKGKKAVGERAASEAWNNVYNNTFYPQRLYRPNRKKYTY